METNHFFEDTSCTSDPHKARIHLLVSRLQLEAALLHSGLRIWVASDHVTYWTNPYFGRITLFCNSSNRIGFLCCLLVGEIIETEELRTFIKSNNCEIKPFELELSEQSNGLLILMRATFLETFDPQAIVQALRRAVEIANSIEPTLREELFLTPFKSSNSTILSK